MIRSGSAEWFERALAKIPGGVNSPVRSFKHVGSHPIYFSRGEGPYLFDVDGNRYTDFCLAFGPHLLGHSPPQVVEAIQAQAQNATSFGACHPGEVNLAEQILAAYPHFDKVRLVNSGTEATMTAIRLARGYTGRDRIVQFEGCYHGHADSFLAKAGSGVAALSDSASRGVPAAVVADTSIARFDSIESLRSIFRRFPDSVAAVILEPVPANFGLWNPGRERLAQIMQVAREHGALVIFDEVISGFRVGYQGAVGYFGLAPDLVTLGKIVGGGLPLAALAGPAKILDYLAPTGSVYQAGTLSGNPLATAAGSAVLQQLKDNPPYAQLEFAATAFVLGLQSILPPPFSVRNLGSMFWIQFEQADLSVFPPVISTEAADRYSRFFRVALDAGLYFSPSPYEVGFVSAAHTPQVLNRALDQLAQAIPSMDR